MAILRYKRLFLFVAFLTRILSVYAAERDYVLCINSINMEEAWVKNFYKELESRFEARDELELKTFQLYVPVLKSEEEVAAMQAKMV